MNMHWIMFITVKEKPVTRFYKNGRHRDLFNGVCVPLITEKVDLVTGVRKWDETDLLAILPLE